MNPWRAVAAFCTALLAAGVASVWLLFRSLDRAIRSINP